MTTGICVICAMRSESGEVASLSTIGLILRDSLPNVCAQLCHHHALLTVRATVEDEAASVKPKLEQPS